MKKMFKTKNKLKNLLEPQSIAVVGATETEGKIGNILSRNLLDLGYQGDIFFVNPKHKKLFKKNCYQSLERIEKKVDLAIIAIPADFVLDVVEKSAGRIKNFVIISAGFSEIGKDGKAKERELMNIAKKNDLNILGPNCLGFINPNLNLNASFAGGMSEKGNIAFISQSGALAVALMDVAKKEGLSFSGIVSVGNKMQLDEIELIKYYAQDKDTKVISLYLEGIKDGRKFIEVAREVSKKKPIVILKSGKGEKSQKAISSHTGALAGSDKVVDVAFEKARVIRADNMENFFDLVKVISEFDVPENNKVAIVTNAGGPGVLTTDAFDGKNLEIAEFSDKVKQKLGMFLPHESSVENPVDLLGDAQEDRYEKTLSVIDREDVSIVFCVLTAQNQTPVEKIADAIIDFKKKTKKIVSTIFIGGDKVEGVDLKLEENGVCNFPFPGRAIDALEKYYNWSIRDVSKISSFSVNSRRRKKAQEIVEKAKNENRKALFFSEAKKLMKLYGINTTNLVEFDFDEKFREKKNMKFPVVLKVDSDRVLHKSDRQGLILGIKNEKELKKAFKKMRKNFPEERMIVQPMLEIETELILGIKKDSVFGPVIIYGLGGIYTEVFKMVDFLVLPMSINEIKNKLIKSKIGYLFEKTRGQKPYDISRMAEILYGLSSLALEVDEIKELDINPLLFYRDKKEVAVDVKVIF